MDIRVKKVEDLTSTEYRACHRANYGPVGYMQEELKWSRKIPQHRPGIAILLWDGPDNDQKSLIGWALLTPVRTYGLLAVTWYTKSRAKYTVQIWVKKQYRRRGHGKTLMNEVKRLDPRPHVLPHDSASMELFSSYKVTVLKDDQYWIKRKPVVA